MIPLERIAAVLLAAGRSERFGMDNKLLAPLDGKPLLSHAAALITGILFGWRLAVTGSDARVDWLLAGFETHQNPMRKQGQDSSVRIGLRAALAHDPEAVLICLADMPYVTRQHLTELARVADHETAASSSVEAHISPPVLLPARLCAMVLEQTDRPVRSFLAGSALVTASPAMLRDFDTREDFAAG